jgi:nucleoside-diphosphate-sugar epimerase
MNRTGKDVIVITGSCGRIGSALCKRLGEKYQIVGFELLKALYASANEELVPVDLGSDESVTQAFTHIRNFYGNKIASVIHLAAYYSFNQKESPLYDKITVQGTHRLLQALEKFEVEQFIFSSTMLIHAPCKLSEKINEDSPINATWGYPRSKVQTEKLIHEMRGKIKSVILRIAGVYDDKCHSIPISNQIQRIWENKLEARVFPGDTTHGASFLHMDDLVDAIVQSVERRKQLPEELVLELGEPKTLSYDMLQRQISRLIRNKEFATMRVPKWFAKMGAFVQELIPFLPKSFVKPWMIDYADDNYILDIARAKKYLDWEPKHSLKETLPVMINFLKSDPKAFYKINLLK